MPYSMHRYLLALFLAPLACLPVIFLYGFLYSLVLNAKSGYIFRGAFISTAFISPFALPAGYLATLLVSAPAIVYANRMRKPLSRRTALDLGLVGGILGTAAVILYLGGVKYLDQWREFGQHLLLGVPSGLLASLFFHFILHRKAGA